jgi:hypothetical protein
MKCDSNPAVPTGEFFGYRRDRAIGNGHQHMGRMQRDIAVRNGMSRTSDEYGRGLGVAQIPAGNAPDPDSALLQRSSERLCDWPCTRDGDVACSGVGAWRHA